LHESISGAANVAPLPLIAPANAGEAPTSKNEVTIAPMAIDLRDFIYFSPLI
jgi:hypothetical protein